MRSARALRTHDLVNAHGDRIRLLNLGARICSIALRTRTGSREVVLGYPRLQDYRGDTCHMGCTAGRVCNRIARSRFTIDGTTYDLAANEGVHHLHGGPTGFGQRYWRVEAVGEDRIAYLLASPNDDQGYPGNLSVRVDYRWNDQRELSIRYWAHTDRATHVNLTNHAYFNLNGAERAAADQRLRIHASRLTVVDGDMIPTGELLPVAGTVLDLRIPRAVSDLFEAEHPLLQPARGPDFNYVLDERGSGAAAELWSATGDLRLCVTTTYPGLQLYGGQHLRAPFAPRGGLCLEPQHPPDAPNRSATSDTLLRPGELYEESITYRFDGPLVERAPRSSTD